MKFVVARVDEFQPGTRRIVRVGGREIGIFRVGERFLAVRNRCPHQGGPLCEGPVFPALISHRPGEVEVQDAMLLMCPWHGWNYDMVTGQAYAPGDARVKSYAVSVESGREMLDSECVGAGETTFVAETFEVEIEDEYVVVEA